MKDMVANNFDTFLILITLTIVIGVVIVLLTILDDWVYRNEDWQKELVERVEKLRKRIEEDENHTDVEEK